MERGDPWTWRFQRGCCNESSGLRVSKPYSRGCHKHTERFYLAIGLPSGPRSRSPVIWTTEQIGHERSINIEASEQRQCRHLRKSRATAIGCVCLRIEWNETCLVSRLANPEKSLAHKANSLGGKFRDRMAVWMSYLVVSAHMRIQDARQNRRSESFLANYRSDFASLQSRQASTFRVQ